MVFFKVVVSSMSRQSVANLAKSSQSAPEVRDVEFDNTEQDLTALPHETSSPANRFETLAPKGSPSPAAGQLLRRGGAGSADAASCGAAHDKQVKQRFDFILVIDFEATCDRGAHDWPNEIIEFPAVALDTRTCKVVAEFQSFVRPVKNPTLTPFCTELTGIQQEDVDSAPTLPEVLRNFDAWFAQHFEDPQKCMIATDGPWDMRDFMYKHSVLRDGVVFPPFFYQWINLRKAYADFFKIKPIGVGQMLTRLGLNFEGRPHSGIDDARNIARIAAGLIQRGARLNHISKIDTVSGEKFAEMARFIERDTDV